MIKFQFCLLCAILFVGLGWSSWDKTHPSEAEFVAAQLAAYDMEQLYGQEEPRTPIIRFGKRK